MYHDFRDQALVKLGLIRSFLSAASDVAQQSPLLVAGDPLWPDPDTRHFLESMDAARESLKLALRQFEAACEIAKAARPSSYDAYL